MAIWQIFMNWDTISTTFFPMAKCFTSQIDFQDHIQRFLSTWTGWVLAFAVLVATFLHLLYNAWKIIRDFALKNWSTKCSIPEDSVHYKRLIQWISRHPASQSLTDFVAPENDEDLEEAEAGVDFGSEKDVLDVKQLMIKPVS